MHILLVADGRSPITTRWLLGLKQLNHQVTLVSTTPCGIPEGVSELIYLPVAFSHLTGNQSSTGAGAKQRSGLRKVVSRFRSVFLAGRYFFGPMTLPAAGRKLQKIIREKKPDLVHALRIPFEGMLASYTPRNVPLVVSIWGNDLTLHAKRSPLMRSFTRKTLERADGLITDALRDIRLAREWGYRDDAPTLEVPTNGGIDLMEMIRKRSLDLDTLGDPIPEGSIKIINPRGIRPAYARTDLFFRAIPLVLERKPNAVFLCPAMAGSKEAEYWLSQYSIQKAVRLYPYLTQDQLWGLFQQSDITVSLTTHDGTPNTLIEAMACGCFPVAGDIESLREWITPGVNGLLVEAKKPQAIAEALVLAMENIELRRRAAEMNLEIITQKAEVSVVRSQLEVFYQKVYAIR